MVKPNRQHDLKGRMPERNEWLVAGGGAKRNPRYHASHCDAKNANITFSAATFVLITPSRQSTPPRHTKNEKAPRSETPFRKWLFSIFLSVFDYLSVPALAASIISAEAYR